MSLPIPGKELENDPEYILDKAKEKIIEKAIEWHKSERGHKSEYQTVLSQELAEIVQEYLNLTEPWYKRLDPGCYVLFWEPNTYLFVHVYLLRWGSIVTDKKVSPNYLPKPAQIWKLTKAPIRVTNI